MSLSNCNFKCSCTVAAVIAGIILGVITAFAQITGFITVVPVFLWVAFGIAAVTLWTLILAAALVRRNPGTTCVRGTVTGLLAGILGTVLLSVVLLAVGIVATSVISAILVGLLVFFVTLIFIDAACFVRCLASGDDT